MLNSCGISLNWSITDEVTVQPAILQHNFWPTLYVLSEGILMEVGINIHHVSGHW